MSNNKATKQAIKVAMSTKRAAIYVRVSSEKQADKVSPEAQEADCRVLAEHQGYVVVAVYRDVEKYRVGKKLVEPSGTRADRPGLRRMLAGADAGLFDVLIAWREDRVYRGVNRAMLEVSERVSGGKMTIELVKEHYDPSTAVVKAWAAGVELQAKRDRMMMGIGARFASGRMWNNMTPYGYALQEGRLVLDPVEADWLLKIWRWFGDGVSVGDIRQRLITGGAKQKRGGGKYVWASSSIRDVLRHDFYHTGIFKVTWDGETMEIPIPIIVDAKTARKVKDRKARYKLYPAGNMKFQSLAAGVVYCKACGVKMRVTKMAGGRYIYYECTNRSRKVSQPGCAKHVIMHRIDDDVWNKVWSEISNSERFEASIRAAIAQRQAQEVDVEAECVKLQAKLDDLALERQKVYTWSRKGQISDDDMEQQIAAIWIEESEIKRELSDKRLLLGGQAERLLRVAQDYRERVAVGVEINFDPQTPEEKQALFEWKRRVVQGIVKRVDVLECKSTEVRIEIDEEKLLEGEPLPADSSISKVPARPRWKR